MSKLSRLIFVIFFVGISFSHGSEPTNASQAYLEQLILENQTKKATESLEEMHSAGDAGRSCEEGFKEEPCENMWVDLDKTKERGVKAAFRCLRGNFLDCGNVYSWLKRHTKERSHIDPAVNRRSVMGMLNRADNFLRQNPQAARCIEDYQKIKNNICFLKANLDQMYIKNYPVEVNPPGLFNSYERDSEWLVIKSPAKGIELARAVSAFGKDTKYPGVSSMFIVKEGKQPFESGENNAVGIIDFTKGQLNLQNASFDSTQYEYYGRKIDSYSFGYGPDLKVPYPRAQNSYCGNYTNFSNALKQSLDKSARGWDPNEADRLASLSIQAGAAEGFLIGAYNLQDAGKNFIDGIVGLYDLVANTEKPDPEGEYQCKKEKNIQAAAEDGGMCTGMRDILFRTIGDGAEKISKICHADNCENNIEAEADEIKCRAINANNDFFKAEIGACFGKEILKIVGPKINEMIQKCIGKKGANEFSRCMANVAVITGTWAAGGGLLKAVKGVNTLTKTNLLKAVKAGKISPASARKIAATVNVAKATGVFTVDMLFNPAPTDLASLTKWRRGLLTVINNKKNPSDTVKLAQKQLADVEKNLKIAKDSKGLSRQQRKAAQAEIDQAKKDIKTKKIEEDIKAKTGKEVKLDEPKAPSKIMRAFANSKAYQYYRKLFPGTKKYGQELIENSELSLAGRKSKIARTLGVDELDPKVQGVLKAYNDVNVTLGEGSAEAIAKQVRIMQDAGLQQHEIEAIMKAALNSGPASSIPTKAALASAKAGAQTGKVGLQNAPTRGPSAKEQSRLSKIIEEPADETNKLLFESAANKNFLDGLENLKKSDKEELSLTLQEIKQAKPEQAKDLIEQISSIKNQKEAGEFVRTIKGQRSRKLPITKSGFLGEDHLKHHIIPFYKLNDDAANINLIDQVDDLQNNPKFFSDHGTEHVQDIVEQATSVSDQLSKLDNIPLERQNFRGQLTRAQAYLHDIGMGEPKFRSIHPELATQHTLSKNFDNVFETIWDGGQSDLAVHVKGIFGDDKKAKLALREMLSMSNAHSKSKVARNLLDPKKNLELRDVMQGASFKSQDYLLAEAKLKKLEKAFKKKKITKNELDSQKAIVGKFNRCFKNPSAAGCGEITVFNQKSIDWYKSQGLDYQKDSFSWLKTINETPEGKNLFADIIRVEEALSVGDSFRQRGTALRASGGHQITMNPKTGKGVIVLEDKQTGLIRYWESNDPLHFGEANIKSSKVDDDLNLKIEIQNTEFPNEAALKNAAKGTNIAIDDIIGDALIFNKGQKVILDVPRSSSPNAKKFVDKLVSEIEAEIGKGRVIVNQADRFPKLNKTRVGKKLEDVEPIIKQFRSDQNNPLSLLDEDQAKAGLKNAELVQLRPGETLFEFGQEAKYVYFPLEENLALAAHGVRSTPIKPKAYRPLGEVAAISDTTRNATIKAGDEGLKLVRVPKEDYLEHLLKTQNDTEIVRDLKDLPSKKPGSIQKSQGSSIDPTDSSKRKIPEALRRDNEAFKTQLKTDEEKLRELASALANAKKDKSTPIQKLTSLDNEMFELNQKMLKDMISQYEKNGITAIPSIDHPHAIELVFDSGKKSQLNIENFYSRVQNQQGIRKITISPLQNAKFGSQGFSNAQSARIDLGLDQARKILDDDLNPTGIHEARHAMFNKWAKEGKESVYHVQYSKGSAPNLGGKDNFYGDHMSAEELYNFSTDLNSQMKKLRQRARQGADKEELLIRLNSMRVKTAEVYHISNQSEKLSSEIVKQLDSVLSGGKFDKKSLKNLDISLDNKGNYFDLSVEDSFGRVAKIPFYDKDLSPGLKKAVNGDAFETRKILEIARDRQETLKKVAKLQKEKSLELNISLKEQVDQYKDLGSPRQPNYDKIAEDVHKIKTNVHEGHKDFVRRPTSKSVSSAPPTTNQIDLGSEGPSLDLGQYDIDNRFDVVSVRANPGDPAVSQGFAINFAYKRGRKAFDGNENFAIGINDRDMLDNFSDTIAGKRGAAVFNQHYFEDLGEFFPGGKRSGKGTDNLEEMQSFFRNFARKSEKDRKVFHLNLDRASLSRVFDEGLGAGRNFNTEVIALLGDPNLLKKTNFYQKGKRLSNTEVEKLLDPYKKQILDYQQRIGDGSVNKNTALLPDSDASPLLLGSALENAPEFSQLKEGDRITLVSVRGNKRTGRFIGTDSFGNIKFKYGGKETTYYKSQLDPIATRENFIKYKPPTKTNPLLEGSPLENTSEFANLQKGNRITLVSTRGNRRKVTFQGVDEVGNFKVDYNGERVTYYGSSLDVEATRKLASVTVPSPLRPAPPPPIPITHKLIPSNNNPLLRGTPLEQISAFRNLKEGDSVRFVTKDGKIKEGNFLGVKENGDFSIEVKGKGKTVQKSEIDFEATSAVENVRVSPKYIPNISQPEVLSTFKKGDRVSIVDNAGKITEGAYSKTENGITYIRDLRSNNEIPIKESRINVEATEALDAARRSVQTPKNARDLPKALTELTSGEKFHIIDVKGRKKELIFEHKGLDGKFFVRENPNEPAIIFDPKTIDPTETAKEMKYQDKLAREVGKGQVPLPRPAKAEAGRVRSTGILPKYRPYVGEFHKKVRGPDGKARTIQYSSADVEYAKRNGLLFENPKKGDLPPGNYTYVILSDGSKVFGKVDDNLEFGVKHIHIAKGREAATAGEIRIHPDGSFDYNILSGSISMRMLKQGVASESELVSIAEESLKEILGKQSNYMRNDSLVSTKFPTLEKIKKLCLDYVFKFRNNDLCKEFR